MGNLIEGATNLESNSRLVSFFMRKYNLEICEQFIYNKRKRKKEKEDERRKRNARKSNNRI